MAVDASVRVSRLLLGLDTDLFLGHQHTISRGSFVPKIATVLPKDLSLILEVCKASMSFKVD